MENVALNASVVLFYSSFLVNYLSKKLKNNKFRNLQTMYFVNNLVETNFIKNFIKSLPIFEGFFYSKKNEKLRLHFLFCAFTINFIKMIL